MEGLQRDDSDGPEHPNEPRLICSQPLGDETNRKHG